MITVTHSVDGIPVEFAVNPATAGLRWPSAAGLYAFCRWNATLRTYDALYIGQAADLSVRLPTHERWAEAMREGMTHVLLAAMPRQGDRDKFEQRMIGNLNPPLNVHHKPTALSRGAPGR